MLYPGTWSAPAEPIVGAESMHAQLRRWLVELGQTEHTAKLVPPGKVHSKEAEGVPQPISHRSQTEQPEVQSA